MDIDILVDCLCDMVGFPARIQCEYSSADSRCPSAAMPEQYRRTVFTASEPPVEQRRSSVPSNTEKIRQAEQCKPVPKAREQNRSAAGDHTIANVSLTKRHYGRKVF